MRAIGLIAFAALAFNCGSGLGPAERSGHDALVRYGCGTCHQIKGVRGAEGLVGPPLTGVGQRRYVAGMLENNPDNLARWIRDPKAINPKTAMPNLGVTEREAGNIAAYLRFLK